MPTLRPENRPPPAPAIPETPPQQHTGHPLAADAAPPFFSWCAVCHRCTPFGYDRLDAFARDGWPVCCGEEVLGCAGQAVPPAERGDGSPDAPDPYTVGGQRRE